MDIVSNVDDARITVDGAFVGTTRANRPVPIEVPRKESLLILEKPGYETQVFQIKTSLNAGFLILDVLFAGVAGILVDAITGGWNDVDLDMRRAPQTRSGSSGQQSRGR